MLLDTIEALTVCAFYVSRLALGYLLRRYWR